MSKAVNPTNYDMIPTLVPKEKDLVFAVIESPAGTRHKYAFEPEYGIMRLKMTLAEGLMWPYDYGFIPQTLGDDGDPIDILVLNEAPTFSGCLLDVRVIGGILLKKNGVKNNRLVACPRRREGRRAQDRRLRSDRGSAEGNVRGYRAILSRVLRG